MKTRAWCVVRGAWLLVLASSAAAQTVEQRVAKAPDGSVRFSFAARPGVYGNGRNMISWDCDKGNCHNRQVDGNWDDHNDWDAPCDSGPVRVALTKSSGRITDLRVYVGGEWRPNTTATDLGTVGTKDAASYLLALALKDESRASEKAIFPAVLADSVTIWPDLLDDGNADHEVRESAVFALSQRPRDEGVPALIRIAKENKDPDLRRKAIFWLGQSDDPRALSLFEELLTRP